MNALELEYLRGSPRTCMAQALDPNKVNFPSFIRLLQCTVAARVSLMHTVHQRNSCS